MSDDQRSQVRENVTAITSVIVTGIWLSLLFLPVGGNLWLAALLFGYVVVVPLVALLFGDEEDRKEWWDDDWFGESEVSDDDQSEQPSPPNHDADSPPSSNRDALETLRERYAAGDLTDDQFDHKLERLLETETIEDVEEWRQHARDGRTSHGTRDPGHDGSRERDPEYET